MSITLAEADRHCRRMLRHYENFTVASRLAPRRVARHLTRLYAFCRTTDDIGDETGDRAQAIARLQTWRRDVINAFNGDPAADPVLVSLQATAREHVLDVQPFLDLIDANLQDQEVQRYGTWPALRRYCEKSAAPVGRVVLRLFGAWNERAQVLSDDVCIGLQLANFAQDVSVDRGKGRTYLVQEDITQLGEVGAIRAMACEAARLLSSGHELEAQVSGRLRLQLALYRIGGEAILDAIARLDHDTRERRPALTTGSRIRVVVRALGATLFATRGRPQHAVPRHG